MVDASCCVGQDGCVAAQELGHTDGQDHLLHWVTLVVVEAALRVGVEYVDTVMWCVRRYGMVWYVQRGVRVGVGGRTGG
jgi:hypothetical protein